jgi:RHS repeat-associated protein
MRKVLLRHGAPGRAKHDELSFTLVVYPLIALVLLSYLSVESARTSHAARRAGPRVLSVSPSRVVPGASETVRVISERTAFGPLTTVHSRVPGVFFTNIRFVSPEEMSFEVYLHERRGCPGEEEIPVEIRSPKPAGSAGGAGDGARGDGAAAKPEETETLRFALALRAEPLPLELELANFGGEDRVTVKRSYVMFGYAPRGYAPFHLSVRHLETGRVHEQETSGEIEHFGVPLESSENPFELVLTDALGRKVEKRVTVSTDSELDPPGLLASRRALTSVYTGNPTQWGSPPSEQPPASDCALGNGPLGCGSGGSCGGGGIAPPPNDYLTPLGGTAVGGDGVLLHNGQFREEVVDLYVPGRGLDFVWKRTYQSGNDLEGYLGDGWDFNWGAHFIVETNASGVPTKGLFSRGDGRRDIYSDAQLQSYSKYVFNSLPAGYVDLETAVISSMSVVTQTKRNGFKQVFDYVSGNLKSRSDRYGNTITVQYDASGDYSRFQDTLNRYITLHYGTSGNASGRIAKISDFAGREVSYHYDEVSGVVVLTKVSYPATDWLDDTDADWPGSPDSARVTDTSRETRYEHYSSGLRLSRIVDGRGKERLENVYDANGRVTTQYQYSTTASHAFAWTLTGGLVSSAEWTDREGDVKTYGFDAGYHLLLSVTVALAGDDPVTTYTRSCSCTIPDSITEPDGGYTTFAVDSNKNVTMMREYHDDNPSGGYTSSDANDLIRKAYFASLNATYFGVVTTIVGPKAWDSSPANEAKYSTRITYDYKGNPLTIEYPATTNPTQDHKELRTYNSWGQLLTVTRPTGGVDLVTTYTYHSSGSENGYLKTTEVLFRASGDPSKLTTTYNYTGFGALWKVTDPQGKVTEHTVDEEFLVRAMKRPAIAGGTPYITEYAYNGERQLVEERLENRVGTEARKTSGNIWWESQWIYGDGGELLTKRREIAQDGMGVVTWEASRHTYDLEYRRTSSFDPLGQETELTLDERGLTTTIVRAAGTGDASTETYEYDLDGNLTRSGRTFQNPGDSMNKEVVEVIEYDPFDRRTKTGDDEGTGGSAAGNYKVTVYDRHSLEKELKEHNASSALLRHREEHYDELDRLWKAERVLYGPSGEVTRDKVTYEYDRAGRLTARKDIRGNATKTEYDLASRLTKEIHPTVNGQASGENYVTYEHDLASNVTKRTVHEVPSGANFVWLTAFDALDRVVSRTFQGSDGPKSGSQYGPDPVSTVDEYDARDLVFTETDPDGIPTDYEYDGLGRRLKTILNAGGTNPSEVALEVRYDLAGNVTSRKDPENEETTYVYDAQNRVTAIRYPRGAGWDYITLAYNDLGEVETRTFGNRPTSTGTDNPLKSIVYHYDLDGLLSKRVISWTATPTWSGYDDYKTTEERFFYDGLYRLTKAEDDDTKVTLVWNSLDQLTQEELEVNLRSGGTDNWKAKKTTAYEWDETGRRLEELTYPISGKVIEETHDALDRVIEIRVGNGTTSKIMAQYAYEGLGLEVTERKRGLDLDANTSFRATYTDDALGRQTEVKHERWSGSWLTQRDLDYEWGDGSNGTTERIFQRNVYDITEGSTVHHHYEYDKLGRLTDDGTQDLEFFYTGAQFWSELKDDGTSVKSFSDKEDGTHQVEEYDPNPQSMGDELAAAYDDAGNLSDLGSGIDFHYDHENRLVHVQGSTDLWLRYDALGRRVAEEDEDYDLETVFYYAGGHIIEETDETLDLKRLSLFGVKLDEVIYSGDVDGSGNLTAHRWPLEDHLGSIVGVYDDSGVEKTDYDYSAYGEATNSGSEAYPYQFTGRRIMVAHDDAVRLLDYRTRAYDPAMGRFLQRDSIGIWGDEANWGNGYAFDGNDPVNANGGTRRDFLTDVIAKVLKMAFSRSLKKMDCDKNCPDLCSPVGSQKYVASHPTLSRAAQEDETLSALEKAVDKMFDKGRKLPRSSTKNIPKKAWEEPLDRLNEYYRKLGQFGSNKYMYISMFTSECRTETCVTPSGNECERNQWKYVAGSLTKIKKPSGQSWSDFVTEVEDKVRDGGGGDNWQPGDIGGEPVRG